MLTARFMSSVHIRSIVATDQPHWRRLWDAYCDFYEVNLSEAVTQRTWSQIMEGRVGGRAAIRDGQMAGFAHHIVHTGTWSASDICYLEDLYVDAGVRGGGIGRALIDDLLAICKREGWARLYWHTGTDNARARALYDSYVPADAMVRYTIPLD